MTGLTQFISALGADARSANVVPAIFVGSVTGINLIIVQNALAAVVFSGRFEPYLLQGTGMFLFGAAVICLVIAISSGYRGALSAPPVSTTMTIPAIVATMAAEGTALFPTTVATLIISSLGAGLCFWIIGHFRLANLMQFIPYPVACGFLAGTGGIVCIASISVMGVTLEWALLSELLEPTLLWKWGPGLGYALALYAATKRWRNVLIFPVSFVAASLLYHLGLAAFGISQAEAIESGLFFGGMAEGDIWPALQSQDLINIDWTAVALQFPNIITLILVTLICVIMNTSGLELSTSTDLNWDMEFKSTGIASLLSGFGGGPPGCLLIAVTTRSRIFQAETWITGAISALIVGSCLFFGADYLKVIPVSIMGGMLFVTGWVMLNEWLVRNRRILPPVDFGIVVLIIVTIVSFGFLEGVGIGMLVTVILFAVRLSHINLVESISSIRKRRSVKARPVTDQAILLKEGNRVRVYELRGYMFFGSAFPLVTRLIRTLKSSPQPACILLDFSSVSGFDLSAINALCRFSQRALAARVKVVLSAASRPLKDGLRRNLPSSAFGRVEFRADMDQGLEQCEDFVLDAARQDQSGSEAAPRGTLLDTVAGDLERQLDRLVVFESLAQELREWVEPREYEKGAALVVPGEPLRGLQLLTAGRASAYDSTETRLVQHVPGDAIEPRAAFGSYRSELSVIADEACRTLTLTPAAREVLERDEKELILELYSYLLNAGP